MEDKTLFTPEERQQALELYDQLRALVNGPTLHGEDESEQKLRHHLVKVINEGFVRRDVFGLNPIITSLQTAILVVEEIGLKREAVIAIMLRPSIEQDLIHIEDVEHGYGTSVARILQGLSRIQELYQLL